MSRKNENNPRMWIPPPDKPDKDSSLLELWSRYCEPIAKFRNFRHSETRLRDYTQTLNTISAALSTIPACMLTAFDILSAITSARTYTMGGVTRLYANSIYEKRLTVIRDTYKYLEARGICSNPLWHPPWELIGDGQLTSWLNPSDLKQELAEAANSLAAKRLLPRYLLDNMERRLVHRIMDKLEDDGRWIGIALLVYQGPRMSEARGVYYGDLVSLTSRSDRHKINLTDSADAHGNKKETMKNRQSVRSVPEHIELMTLLNLREVKTKTDTGTDDISDLPIICYKNDYTRPCTSVEFAVFVRRELDSLFCKDLEAKQALLIDLYLNDDPVFSANDQLDPADLELSGRLFRRNYITQCYCKTDMSDDDIAVTVGHKLAEKIDHIYSERNILRLMEKLDHRMIVPELHPGWNITLHPDDDVKIVDCGTMFFTFDPSIYEQGGTIEIVSQSALPGDAIVLESNRSLPTGVTIDFEALYIPQKQSDKRPNTDTLHQPLPRWPKTKEE